MSDNIKYDIKCPRCKTEYNLKEDQKQAECPVCHFGAVQENTWNETKKQILKD